MRRMRRREEEEEEKEKEQGEQDEVEQDEQEEKHGLDEEETVCSTCSNYVWSSGNVLVNSVHV